MSYDKFKIIKNHRFFFILYLNRDERGSCLLNRPSYNMLKLYPIDIPNSNRQCQLAYGKSSRTNLVFDSMVSCEFMNL